MFAHSFVNAKQSKISYPERPLRYRIRKLAKRRKRSFAAEVQSFQLNLSKLHPIENDR